MSDETTTTPETTEPETKRTRTVWPITICRVDGGSLIPIKDSPEFSETAAAMSWLQANAVPGMAYKPVRIGPGRRLKTSLEPIE